MSARHRHTKTTSRAWMQVCTDWGNAKRLPESFFHWLYLRCRQWRLDRARR
jgi:hypothetical protein